jgi:hypothetical protein
VQRELVIDIDISDYDELRTCGSGGHICTKCWPFMAVAIQVGLFVWVGGAEQGNTTHAGILARCRVPLRGVVLVSSA